MNSHDSVYIRYTEDTKSFVHTKHMKSSLPRASVHSADISLGLALGL